MSEAFLILNFILVLIAIALIIVFRSKPGDNIQLLENRINDLQNSLKNIERGLKDDFRINREENSAIAKDNRFELNYTLKEIKSEMEKSISGFKNVFDVNIKSFNDFQKEKFGHLDIKQKELIDLNFLQLDRINNQVQEKLKILTEQAKTDSAEIRKEIEKTIRDFQESFEKNVKSFNELQKEKFQNLEVKQNELVRSTETKLDIIKSTVEEKLEKTLSERLGQSFETVGKQLIEVQKGLGEMQTLAQDVGGLKKVLSNVKMRGGIGEIQLEMLLEQILAPEQYEANVKTKAGSTESVEFAIKLPGRDGNKGQVWLPVDAKFPKEVYEQLQSAYDIGEPTQIELAQKNLDATIKKMARSMCEKYINPPDTTDFAIMFLPFEGIYAEVVRKASLLEELQRSCKVIVTGPTTFAAILNSLQMGFKTLAIQRRSGEVWQVLGAVKKEFETFGGLLSKAQNNIHTGLKQLDDVMGTRTRAIQRKLKDVETLSDTETNLLMTPSTLESSDEEGIKEI